MGDDAAGVLSGPENIAAALAADVDGAAPAQTAPKEDNPSLQRLISAFKRISGVPVVVNASFNVQREPILRTPAASRPARIM